MMNSEIKVKVHLLGKVQVQVTCNMIEICKSSRLMHKYVKVDQML